MATKIRLQRHGKKRRPFYHIVIADSRAKRDGKFIEKIGTYNPNTKPASIDLNFDSALSWLQKGAIPTDTARAILSYKGVLLKKHLLDGVKKGAFDENTAEERFNKWINEKEEKINQLISSTEKEIEKNKQETIDREKIVRAKKEEAIAAKIKPATEEAPAAEEAPATEEAPGTEEAPAAEEAPEVSEDSEEK